MIVRARMMTTRPSKEFAIVLLASSTSVSVREPVLTSLPAVMKRKAPTTSGLADFGISPLPQVFFRLALTSKLDAMFPADCGGDGRLVLRASAGRGADEYKNVAATPATVRLNNGKRLLISAVYTGSTHPMRESKAADRAVSRSDHSVLPNLTWLRTFHPSESARVDLD